MKILKKIKDNSFRNRLQYRHDKLRANCYYAKMVTDDLGCKDENDIGLSRNGKNEIYVSKDITNHLFSDSTFSPSYPVIVEVEKDDKTYELDSVT